jgi:hypothetical protein
LKHKPQRQRYFNLYDAFSTLEMSSAEFKDKYPYGFLVPITENLQDNTVIHEFRSIYEQSKQLGIEFSKDDIEIIPAQKDIIEIRKIRNSGNVNQILIGRSPRSDIIFGDNAVSQTHACIYVSTPDLTCYLVDLKSLNGTFLNSKKLQSNEKYKLSKESEITFGPRTKVTFFPSRDFYRYLHSIIGRQKI